MSIVIIGELFGTTCMKLADRFKNKLPTAVLVLGYIVAFVALRFAIMDLPLGVATRIWAGACTTFSAIMFR